MKKLLFCLALCLLFCSCGSPRVEDGSFHLLPVPQEFTITGASALYPESVYTINFTHGTESPSTIPLISRLHKTKDFRTAHISAGIDPAAVPQQEGYHLTISEQNISIAAHDKPGLFYAFMTLQQLFEDASEQYAYLPLCSIKDYPLLSYRAIHLDIKHHLERKEYYYSLIDELAGQKINAIIVEMEDKLKYATRPLIGSDDAFTIEEWQELSDYAAQRHISISPLIQGLGHASFILKHEKYKHLRDDPASDWAFNPLEPETYELQFDLYRDAIKATPHGKYLHIGGDEVHTTGRGSGKSALELQLEWLDKVCAFASEQGRIPIFWDDMPLKHAGVYNPMFNPHMKEEEVEAVWQKNEHKLLAFLDQFPQNCIYMRWNYRSPQAYGNGKAMEWFRSHGLQVMGATAGQTRWVLMPQNESNMENIKNFAVSSIETGLSGLLLTLWDDDSPHFELFKRGIAAFAEYTWSGDKRSKAEIKAAWRQRSFGGSLHGSVFGFVDRLEAPVAFYKNALLNGNQRNYLRRNGNAINDLVTDLPDPENPGRWSRAHAEHLQQAAAVSARCDSIGKVISIMKKKAVRNRFRLEIYEQVNRLVQFSCSALLQLSEYDTAPKKEKKRLLGAVRNLAARFADLRKRFEAVYGQTRVLNKPENYILDQDHHVHLANQSISFDWQFYAEMLFLEKVLREL